MPASLGVDPCACKQNGELVPWQTPHGATALRWAVALPMYTWADSIQALFPNGRGSDGEPYAPAEVYESFGVKRFVDPPGIDYPAR